jgi:hypothetical protein
MRVKKVSGSSTMGWKPTNPPMRGYISSTGIVAWPHPNVCTHRSAWMVSAMISAAFRIAGSWVFSMSSRMERVAFSQRVLSIFSGSGWSAGRARGWRGG